MVVSQKVVDADKNVKIADIERQPVDDNALIFLFQNKIFNCIQDENTEKAIKSIMFLDAHLEPYKHRWYKDKIDENKEKVRGEDGKPIRVLQYPIHLKKINIKFKDQRAKGGYLDEDTGKFIRSDDDSIQFNKAVEWYRLQRILMRKANILPHGSIEVEI